MDDITTKGEWMTVYFFVLLESRRACQEVQKLRRPTGRLGRAKKFLNDNRKPIGGGAGGTVTRTWWEANDSQNWRSNGC